MLSTYAGQSPREADTYSPTDMVVLLGIAAAVAILHLLTNHLYGLHRDELQFLSDARHLDWGFVAYPPLTPFVERISLEVFGLSMVGLRLASVLAQSLAILVTGMMTRELGGRRLAQVAAALAVALSPVPLFEGTEFQYTTFDYLWWVLVAYFVIRLLKTENPRWWLAAGAAVGAGLMTKYTMFFFLCGLLCGFLLTQARRFLLSRWSLAGAGIALLIFSPNVVWQVRHGFISYHFLHYIHLRDVRLGRANGFLLKQFVVCTNFYAAPLWITGLWCFLRSPRYRPLAWMYVIPLAFFYFAQGLFYYLAPAYPMLIAMGAAAGEQWVRRLPLLWRRVVEVLVFAGIAGAGAYSCALILPLASGGPLMRFALERNDALREEFGWNELVRTVAGIRDSLPAQVRQEAGVVVGNYGEQGAIEILGLTYRLPPPISTTNSAWLRGYPSPAPSTLIVIGFSREDAERAFMGCRLAGHNGNSYGVKNEESQVHPDIFVCGGPRKAWPEFWKEHQAFG
jgi:4-amino-4-deoxy-L-arabinose transferase-like glycosyltransferase